MVAMPEVTPQIRRVLEHRSVADKIGVPRSCALLHEDDLPSVSWLVREGYMIWLDRAYVTEYYIPCDIYQLTEKGVALCNSNGIAQRVGGDE